MNVGLLALTVIASPLGLVMAEPPLEMLMVPLAPARMLMPALTVPLSVTVLVKL